MPGLGGPVRSSRHATGRSPSYRSPWRAGRTTRRPRRSCGGALDGRPAGFGGLPGRPGLRHGHAARASTSRRSTSDASPRVRVRPRPVFLLLLVVFHSLVIPIKAILLNLLSAGAATGSVAVFQDGCLGRALGMAPPSVIESWVPIFIFTILFGLSMDYHVFILTRVKEARDRELDFRSAVARGISITSGTITSAATIMVVVFAAFVTIPFVVHPAAGARAGGRRAASTRRSSGACCCRRR